MTQSLTWRDLNYEGHVSFLPITQNSEPYALGEERFGVPQSIFKAYQLRPESVQRYGHVFRIQDRNGYAFALKQARMTETERQRLLNFYQVTQQNPIRTPELLRTSNGQVFYQEGANTYFLTPWIRESESARSEQWEFLWDTLADWHRMTARAFEVEATWLEAFTERCFEVWSEQVLSLDLFMNDCEHRIYPSPFEQRFMAFYQDLRSGAEEAYGRMKTWEESVSDKKNIRVVFCQGKPSPAHLIVSGRQRNWISTEASSVDLPIRDLTWLLRWGQQGERKEALQRGMDLYETTFPLEEHEKMLLAAHLIQPARIIKLLHQYKSFREGGGSMREQTLGLEEAFHHWGKTWQALSAKLEEKPRKETDETSEQKQNQKKD